MDEDERKKRMEEIMRRLEEDERRLGVGVSRFILNGKVPEACGNLMRWAMWMENARRNNKQIVARTEIAPHFTVSTIFLGLNHNWGGGPPLLFATMAFGPEEQRTYKDRNGKIEHYTAHPTLASDLYSTWDDAVAGHARIVTEIKELAKKNERDALDVIARGAKLPKT